MDGTTTTGQVVSVLPGRVRVRLHPHHRGQLRKLQEHLADQPGVNQVSVNPTTGSVLIHANRHELSSDDVIAMLRDVGIFVAGVGESTDPITLLSQGDVADNVVSSVDDLGRRLSGTIGLDLDLKLIAPLAVGAVGLRQLLVGGLGQVSGYLLLWVAFDLFYKFHHAPRSVQTLDEASPLAHAAPARTAQGA